MLSKEALQEFKKIWVDKFGRELPDDEAVKEATNLLTLFDAIYRPIKKESESKVIKLENNNNEQ